MSHPFLDFTHARLQTRDVSHLITAGIQTFVRPCELSQRGPPLDGASADIAGRGWPQGARRAVHTSCADWAAGGIFAGLAAPSSFTSAGAASLARPYGLRCSQMRLRCHHMPFTRLLAVVTAGHYSAVSLCRMQFSRRESRRPRRAGPTAARGREQCRACTYFASFSYFTRGSYSCPIRSGGRDHMPRERVQRQRKLDLGKT